MRLILLCLLAACALSGCIITEAKICKATTVMNGRCTEPGYNHQYCSYSHTEHHDKYDFIVRHYEY